MRAGWKVITALVVALLFTMITRLAADRRDQSTEAMREPAPTQDAPGGDSTGDGGGDGPGVPDGAAVDPDSFFEPTTLRPGEKPPQFVIVSFDGAGSHEKWTYWKDVGQRSDLRFTGFLSGIYLVDEAHRTAYQGPGHEPGASAVGFADDGPWISTLVADLNDAWARGHEIGTHYNGHFCSGGTHPVGEWSTADWDQELTQFFTFFRDYAQLNELADAPQLQVPAESVLGGRTPCLELQTSALYPALRAHGLTYDSSGVQNGLSWPVRKDGIWEFPLSYVPLAGSDSGVLAMDYNFWYKQTSGNDSAGNPTADSAQVLQTYRNMFNAAYQGNRAPLILGNHFNSWNDNAYTFALANFVEETCVKPDVACVPYRDVIRWMEKQDPTVLAGLQKRPAVYTVG